MKIKLLVGALVVLIVMNIAALGAFLFVHVHNDHRGHLRAGFRGDHRRAAGALNDDERKKLFNAMKSFHEEVRPLADNTKALEDDLMVAMRENPVPRARVDSLLQQISANRLDIARRATDRMIAMGDSLSPDERAHLVDALMRMRRGGPGRERGHQRGDRERR